MKGKSPRALPEQEIAAATRRVQDVKARYDAAGMGRRVAQWSPPSTGPNRAITGLQRIRDRARDSSRNDWAGESGTQKWVTNLVGVGITPRWKNEQHGKLWAKFVPHADADGVLDAYGLQTLLVRAWLDGGEVFIRRRPRSLELDLPVPVQFQLLEADQVPLFDATVWPGMPPDNEITQGIERNRYGRRVAYWMYRQHPGDGYTGRPDADKLLRIPADDVAHVFEPKRPGQMRGVSMLAPVLVKLRASMDFEDAVLDRQKLANLYTMFVTRPIPEDWDGDVDPLTGLPSFYSNDGQPVASLEPGMAQELRPGEDVKFADPPEAGTTYSEYMRTSHMGTAAGTGLPYELFSGDIKDVSDRTLRVVLNEFRRFARQRQWQIIIPQAVQKMIRWWSEAAALAGLIPLADLDDAMSPEYAPEGWDYIHPVQDVEGKIKARDAGLISTSALISERGDDPRVVLAQIKADKASGLTPAEPAPAADAMAEQLRDLADHRAVQARANAELASRVTGHIASEERQRAADHRAFTDSLLAVASRPINVAAPSVVNEVQPATVDLTVDVNLPNREIRTDLIEHDSDGNLKKVVQTERTIQ